MDAAKKVKMVGLWLGLAGLGVGCGIVWLLMGDTKPREEEPSESAKDSQWPALARYGSWEVQCRQNKVQARKECRLEASWSRTGKVHYYPFEGIWNLVNTPNATTASLTVDSKTPIDGRCSALCTFPGDKSVALSEQVTQGRGVVVAAVTSSGQKTGGSIGLNGFADALAKARSSAVGKAR